MVNHNMLYFSNGRFSFNDGRFSLKSKTKLYSIIFISLSATNFVTSLLQHYNFTIMGERLIKRIREKILEKLMTFEVC